MIQPTGSGPGTGHLVRFSCRLAGSHRELIHHWSFSIGSGHAPLALRADWQRQVARCQRELGIRRVRFHGLLSDAMGTCVREQGSLIDSWYNADAVFDFLVDHGMAPLVELSFMPSALASGDQTVMHYRANVTPPKDPSAWSGLIARLASHWLTRYGRDRLLDWRFEVWNEPNEPSFWTGGQQGYFDLYRLTAHALKGISPELRVGGPVTSKTAWLPEFLDFLKRTATPCDFISTHLYPTDAVGGAGTDTTSELAQSGQGFLRERLLDARRIVGGFPLLLTEWSITSNPRDPFHDQPIAAAYLLNSCMDLAGVVEGSSWWTVSDIFEENFFPGRPFHGGFGVLTIDGVPKPTYRALQWLHQLGDRLYEVEGSHANVRCWVVGKDEHHLGILVTNLLLPGSPPRTEIVEVRIADIPNPGQVTLQRIDDDHASAVQTWQRLGEPTTLTRGQVAQLEAASALVPEILPWRREEDAVVVRLSLMPNASAFVAIDFPTDVPAIETPASGSYRPEDDDTRMLTRLQEESYTYFLHHHEPANGLVRDNSSAHAPVSIAATGLSLACAPLAVERRFLTRAQAAERVRRVLRFLMDAPQGPAADTVGDHGFFYHFLNPATGRRTWDCELSTIDTTLLIAGGLLCGAYFAGDDLIEREIHDLAQALYERIDWAWALDGALTLSHGWKPGMGFLPSRWQGYSEAMLLYLLALGSPTHPIPAGSWDAWCATYPWKQLYGQELVYAGPLFIHQLSHCFIDFRGLQDPFMRAHGSDYFENSRRATIVQSRYAAENPLGLKGYGETVFGFTASEGPGPATLRVDGVQRTFFGYEARGAPFGPDDGTIAPWAAAASLPFAPELVLRTLRRLNQLRLREHSAHGFVATFNPTYPNSRDPERGWVAQEHYGLNQGPLVLMIENHLTGLPWTLMRRVPALVRGLQRAGFQGGWLDEASTSP